MTRTLLGPAAVATLTLNPAIDRTVFLDRLVPGHVHRARATRSDAGGKGVNVAGCLADWGVRVAATGILGDDTTAPFAKFLAAKGIEDRFVRVPGETRTNLKLLVEGGGDTTDVNLPGLDVTPETFAAVRAALLDIATPEGIAVLAGSLPPGVAPDAYPRLARDLKARKTRVILDASGPALSVALAAGADALPYAVKPNRAEIEEWAGRPLAEPGNLLEATVSLHRRGIPLVAVSLGGEGALFVSAEGAVRASPPPQEVASTVGAGDALVAGLAAGLHAGLALADLARLALAFAAGKLTRPGANLPDKATVEQFGRAMTIERVRD